MTTYIVASTACSTHAKDMSTAPQLPLMRCLTG
eukprot:UN12787